MAKKSLFVGLAIIVLCLCCGVCFAEDKDSSINLGNEIMESIDKTGDSMNNIISGNITRDAGNAVRDGGNNIKDGANGIKNDTKDFENGAIRGNAGNGNYNATRTTTEGTTSNNNGYTMTTTTWMWIILVVAAVIIIAAIWYYATQNNS